MLLIAAGLCPRPQEATEPAADHPDLAEGVRRKDVSEDASGMWIRNEDENGHFSGLAQSQSICSLC